MKQQSLPTMTTTKPRDRSFRDRSLWILGAIVVVAAVLRLWRLGALGIVSDEDLSILAVDGILAHGYPLLPSGMIYLRLGWFGYLIAASAAAFGHEEFWLRLPADRRHGSALPL